MWHLNFSLWKTKLWFPNLLRKYLVKTKPTILCKLIRKKNIKCITGNARQLGQNFCNRESASFFCIQEAAC